MIFLKKNKVTEIVNFFLKIQKRRYYLIDHLFTNIGEMQTQVQIIFFSRENKWPKFPPTSCISIRKNSLKKLLEKIHVKRFHELWFDFRLSTYFTVNKNQFNFLEKNLTFIDIRMTVMTKNLKNLLI